MFPAEQCAEAVYQNNLLPGALLTISFTDRRSQGGHSLDGLQEFITPTPLP